MSGWLYTDFLEVDRHFIDVYTEEVDRQHTKAWRSYIPQEKTRELLTNIADMLERKSTKPPLFFGPYGTGKTFTAFLIKHLLEDDVDEVVSYFEQYPVLRSLRGRWEGLRKRGPIVVAYRSSASDVGTSFRLAYIVQERITKALLEKGYKVITDTLRQEVLDRLQDSQSTFNWPRAFEKHRFRFKEFSSPAEVIDQLEKAGEKESLGLMERVVRTLEEERFFVALSVERLKEWVKEVIRQNGLQGLLFLWDEFTDFFNLPNPPIDMVQELAHLANETPFYLGLIIHRAPEIALRRMDEKDKQKFLDRFQRHHLELAEVTAYQLMGGVIRVKPERRGEWERKRESLWGKVEGSCSLLLPMEGGKKDDFRQVIPIHPYAAYILANIARSFSSSQRTLFRFLRGEESKELPEKFSFSRFLQEYPREDWYWLTADFLWDYFYAEDDPEYPEEVRRFISHYRARVGSIKDEVERRVYKTVLLLDLLHRRLPSEHSLTERSLEPTRSRLHRVFEGVLSKEEVSQALNSLCEKHLLQRYPIGHNEGYTLPLYVRDEKKLQEIKKRLQNNYKFKHLAKRFGDFGKLLAQELELAPPLGMRQELCIVAAEEFLTVREWVLPEDKLRPYQLGMVVVLPFDRKQLISAKELAANLSGKTDRVIYAVAEQEFGDDRWDQWLEQKALAEYAREQGEGDSERSYQGRANELISEWVQEVVERGFRVFPPKGEATSVVGKEGCREFLEGVVARVYPLRPEIIFPTGTLYSGTWGRQGAEIGLGVASKLQNPFAEAVEKLKKQGIWDAKDWPEEHPLTHMRIELRRMLEEQGEIKLAGAWKKLMAPPYGLMPSRIGIMLFALLLREYTEGHYYWDGNRCESLNAATLAGLVESVTKGAKGAENYAIRKMLPVEEKVCELLREFFALPLERTRYLRTTLIELREFFRCMGYPLWALGYVGDSSWSETLFEDVNRLQQLMISNPDTSNWQQEQLERLKDRLIRLHPYLAKGVATRKASYAEGMRRFLEQEDPELWRLCKALELNLDRLMEKLRNLLQEEVAFWNKKKVSLQLRRLKEECQLTLALNELMGTSFKDLLEALNHLRREWVLSQGKLPLWLITEVAEKELREALELLTEFFETEGFSPLKDSDRLSSWAQRSPLLSSRKEEVRRALKEQEEAFLSWLQKSPLASEISTEEAGELLKRLSEEPQLHKAKRWELENLLRKHLKELERQRLAGELRWLWSEITGTATPSQWSEGAGIPIHFLLTERELQDALSAVEQPSEKGEGQLRAALETLKKHREDFARLRDTNWVKGTFMRKVASDYASLVSSDQDMDSLKEFLSWRLGPDFSRWDLWRAREVVEKWAEEHYRQSGYHRVLAKLRELPPERLWALVERLAEDPRVGMQLLREL